MMEHMYLILLKKLVNLEKIEALEETYQEKNGEEINCLKLFDDFNVLSKQKQVKNGYLCYTVNTDNSKTARKNSLSFEKKVV